jgi:hypothetical protein
MKRAIIGTCALAVVVMLYSAPARAQVGSRMIPGAACFLDTTVGFNMYFCPYVSDSEFPGASVAGIYVDYNQPNNNTVTSFACWQSWTGDASACTPISYNGNVTFGYGDEDVYLPGFATLATDEDPTDYFYVSIYGASSIGTLYGVTYMQPEQIE